MMMKRMLFAMVLTTVSAAFAATEVEAPEVLTAVERTKLPVFRSQGNAWKSGFRPQKIIAWECTVAHALVTDSVKVTSVDGTVLKKGVDFEVDPVWGAIGLTPAAASRKDETMTVSYAYRQQRIDSKVESDGKTVVRKGEPKVYMPVPPALKPGERLVENVFYGPQGVERFPVTATAAEAPRTALAALTHAPKTFAKLLNGKPVTILAWGDSVTACGFLPKKDEWQEQFVRRLRANCPKSAITLISNGWGGRTTRAFLAEPEGSPRNFTNTVLSVKADLVISEFVNDCGLPETAWKEIYPRLLRDFRAHGIEWIILTPHYVRPDWMGLRKQTDCDKDPRPYVAYVRRFAVENGVGLADAALRWGHLWREGIPYQTLFVNDINHPNAQGMSFFADALADFFGLKNE